MFEISFIKILIMQFRWKTSFPKEFEIVAYHATPYFLFWGICVPRPKKTFLADFSPYSETDQAITLPHNYPIYNCTTWSGRKLNVLNGSRTAAANVLF